MRRRAGQGRSLPWFWTWRAARSSRPAGRAARRLRVAAQHAVRSQRAGIGAPAAAGAQRRRSCVTLCRDFSHAAPGRPDRLPGPARASRTSTPSSATSRRTRSRRPARSARAGRPATARATRAAYWAPTLYANGQRGAAARRDDLLPPAHDARRVRAVPRTGSRSSPATRTPCTPQSTRVTYWDCDVIKTTLVRRRRDASTMRRPPGTRAAGALSALPGSRELQLLRQLPGLLQRQARQLGPPAPHGLLGRRPVPGEPSDRRPGDLARLPSTRRDRGDVFARVGEASTRGTRDFMNGWTGGALTELVDDCLNAHISVRLCPASALDAALARPATRAGSRRGGCAARSASGPPSDSPRSIALELGLRGLELSAARASSSMSSAPTAWSTSAIARSGQHLGEARPGRELEAR